VFWAYFSGLILTMGAIVTLLHERKHRKPEIMEPFYPSQSQEEHPDASSGVRPPGTGPAIVD
jgi:hypothetical protein